MLARFAVRFAVAVGVALGGGIAVGQDLLRPPPNALDKMSPDTTNERVQEVPQAVPFAPPLAFPPPAAPPPCPRVVPVGPPHDVWFSAQYIGYTFRPAPLGNPLLSGSSADGTRVLIGGADAKFGWTSAVGLTGGAWFDEQHKYGVEFSGFVSGRRTAASEITAAAGQTLTRPFVDALTGGPARFFVAAPGFLAGSFQAESAARLDGATARIVVNRSHAKELTVDLFAGVRYLDLDETLLLTQTTTATGAGSVLLNGVSYPPGVPLTVTDRFRTRNQFYGGELGGKAELRHGPAFVAVTPSIAFGPVHQTVQAAGSSAVPGVELPGGLYAVTGGNAGRDVTGRFAVMTEVRTEVGLYLTGSTRLSVGYDFLYLGSAARPGEQIDFVVNTRLVPAARRFGSLSGTASPLPTAARTDFQAHALRAALEYRY